MSAFWLIVVVLASLSIGVDSVHAQTRQPLVLSGPLYFSFPLLTEYPPVSADMPRDVAEGYLGFDDLARTATADDVEKLLKNVTYSDTLRRIAGYLYALADYDPIQFHQWLTTSPQRGLYKSAPAYLRRQFIGLYEKLAPDAGYAVPLLVSDVILHIRVTDVRSTYDSTAALAKSAQVVTAYVIDTIKGRHLPSCGNIAPVRPAGMAAQDGCLEFEYRLEWRRLNHAAAFNMGDSMLVDSEGKPWVKQSMEYIVFLRFLNLGRDTRNNYASLVPVTRWGTMACMYPIIDGRVYDPYNDFGFGNGLTARQFKNALRGGIASLTQH